MWALELWFKWDVNFCAYKDDFFYERIIGALHRSITESDGRKREFKFGEIPSDFKVLSEAMKYARERTRTDFNIAILKEYRPWEWSGAYDWHIDPDRFFGWPLGICTLQGESELWVRDGEWLQVDITTIPNRLVLADPKLEHRASPPKNSDWRRSFLFLWVEE